MIRPRKNLVLSLGLACMLALGVMGCSASVESTTTTEVSTTDEDGNTTTTTTESTSGASTEDGVTGETTTQTSVTVDLDDWTAAWMGETDKGYTAYYAQAPENPQALIAVYNPETQELVSCLGNYESPEEGALTVTDAGNGNAFTFFILEETDEGATLDLGEEFGTAVCQPTDFEEFIENLQTVDVNHQLFAE